MGQVATSEWTKEMQTVFHIVRYKVFTAVTTKNAVFWDVTPCGYCKNRSIERTYRHHHKGDKFRRVKNNVGSN
jgi:hypothetical protein